MILSIKELAKHHIIRNVFVVATGTAGAQAITMAFAPIVTRLYGPEAFGILGAFTAVLAIVTPIAALTYPVAIVLPKTNDDAKGIAKLSAGLAFIVALLIAVMTLLFGSTLADLLNLHDISGFLIFIPIAMFFSALQQIIQQWLIRQQQFKVTARVAVSQSLILNSLKVVIGFAFPTGLVLVTLTTLSNAFYATQLWLGSKRWLYDKAQIDTPINTSVSLRQLAYQHRDFPLFRAPQVLVNALTGSAPILVLAMFFDAKTVGYFTLSNAVLAAPAVLIGKSVGSVFYPNIVENIHAGKKGLPLLIKAIFVLAFIGFIPFSLIFLFAEELFSVVFGSQWVDSGSFASILTISVFLGVVHRPCESVMYAYRLTRQYFFIELVFTLMMIVLMLYLGMAGLSAYWIVLSYMLVKSLYYSFLMVFCVVSLRNIQFKQ